MSRLKGRNEPEALQLLAQWAYLKDHTVSAGNSSFCKHCGASTQFMRETKHKSYCLLLATKNYVAKERSKL